MFWCTNCGTVATNLESGDAVSGTQQSSQKLAASGLYVKYLQTKTKLKYHQPTENEEEDSDTPGAVTEMTAKQREIKKCDNDGRREVGEILHVPAHEGTLDQRPEKRGIPREEVFDEVQ